MRSLLWRLALGLAASMAVAGSAVAADPGAGAAAAGPDRQILVLLRLPPEHVQPGGDYGGGYGDDMGRSARRRVAIRLARENGLTLVDDWPMPLLGVDCYVMETPAGRSVEDAARRLSREPGVAWSEPSHLYHAQGKPAGLGDPLFRVQPAAREWRLADLRQLATGRDVRVAVIDSKIEQTHPDLAGQVEVSRDFVPERPGGPEVHGTGVAGIIAAKADNGVGIAGVAPRARLMALRACWQTAGQRGGADTICDSLSLAKALHFAVDHNAQVINLSLSGPPDALLGGLLDVALARGATVVAAYDQSLPGGGFPASHPGVVAVVEESPSAPPAGVFAAPGRDVPTTQPGGRWFLVSGNSYAAAHVSGLFALVREKRRAASPIVLLAAPSGRAGAIDACATVLRVTGPCDCACAHPRQYSAADR